MSHILDRVATSSNGFRPATVREYFALQLAEKLFDIQRLRMYVNLTDRHSEETLLQAFRKSAEDGSDAKAQRFHEELKALTRNNDE
jgi:hypothetical protein